MIFGSEKMHLAICKTPQITFWLLRCTVLWHALIYKQRKLKKDKATGIRYLGDLKKEWRGLIEGINQAVNMDLIINTLPVEIFIKRFSNIT